MEKELDLLFGDLTQGRTQFEQLKYMSDPNNEQISSQSMNNKTILDSIKEKVEEVTEYNTEEELISTKNSDHALPDELSTKEGIPITKVTQGIHDADNTDNEELISTHNSQEALSEQPLNKSEHIEIISTHNSSKFVDESLN